MPHHRASGKSDDAQEFACPYCKNVPDQRSNTKAYSRVARLSRRKGGGRPDYYSFICFNCNKTNSLLGFLQDHLPALRDDFVTAIKAERKTTDTTPATDFGAEAQMKAKAESQRSKSARGMTGKERLDDEDVATAFIAAHRERFRYDPTWSTSRDEKGGWLFFNGSTWSHDTGNTVGETVGTIVRQDSKVSSAIRRLKTKSAIQQTAWDVRPDLIGFTNGVFDLAADEFRLGRHDDYLTKACSVAYNPTAKAPRWERFLHEVFEPTLEVVPFLQELLGYMFTGYTDPHLVTFFHGAGGRNGKSTLCKVLQRLCGDYTWSFNAQRIFGHKTPDITNDIADFKGYRFVYSNELPKQVKLTSTQVKLLSGGDEIVARQLFAVNQNISPTWHMVIVSNHVPSFDDDGDALWDRVLCIPFNVRFEGARQDRTLDETLFKEGEGILAWIVAGARRYIANGRQFTRIPDVVRVAGEQMRALARSSIDAFIHERLEKDAATETPAKDIWEAYQQWCVDNDVPMPERLTMTKLGRELSERFRKGSHPRTRTVVYIGVGLKGAPKLSPEHGDMMERQP